MRKETAVKGKHSLLLSTHKAVHGHPEIPHKFKGNFKLVSHTEHQ